MVASSSLNFPLVGAPVNANQFIWGGSSASAITVDTPTSYLPGQLIWVTGTYTGTPLNFNYSVNGGSSYLPVQGLGLDSFGNFSFPISAGLAAGSYTVKVRDANVPTVIGTSGTFVVSTFNPNNLASGVLLWDNDPNDRTLVYMNGYTAGNGQVNNITNKVNPRQYLIAHNGYPSGVPILLQRGQGSDALHSVYGMKVRTTSPLSTYDPTTNQFQAGGLQSSCAGIIRALQNLGPASSAALTCITAVKYDGTLSATFMAGLLGIAIPSNPNRPFIQLTPRNDTTKLGGEWVDANGNIMEGDSSAYPPTLGWYVLTTLIGGGTLTTRVNKTAGTPGAAGSAGLVTAINEFSLGGDGGTTAVLNGAAYPFFGRQMLFLGTLTGADLTSAETLVGNSIGLSI